ncbi:MAG: hypothetical protein CL828_05500 [Crocinitomicaceae bacterium]|nr:hypothetical protein [Crocinitomicaceae bacterium]
MTDENLQEVDRFEMRCQRLPWVIPAPMALKVTGVTPSMLDGEGLPSFYDMMSEIRHRMEAWGPAVYVGYNSIRFDEPLLQRAFWQTLHPPYLTVTNNNSRMDILPLVQAASHLYPGAFQYPLTPRGRTGFKLDQLAPLNGFSHENAHDALADVEATIHIACLLAERCPELWQSSVHSSPKSAMVSSLAFGKPVLIVEYFMNGPSVWWGQRIDQRGSNTSAASIARLEVDWPSVFSLEEESLLRQLSASPKPIRQIALNKAPIVLDEDAARQFDIQIDPSLLQVSHALASDEDACTRMIDLMENLGEPWPEPEHLEQRIFDGFPSRADNEKMEAFHRGDWAARSRLVREFDDTRFRQLAQRLVYCSAPERLSETERASIGSAISERLFAEHEDDKLWRTLQAARRELHEVRSSEGGESVALEIDNWLNAIEQQFENADRYKPH